MMRGGAFYPPQLSSLLSEPTSAVQQGGDRDCERVDLNKVLELFGSDGEIGLNAVTLMV